MKETFVGMEKALKRRTNKREYYRRRYKEYVESGLCVQCQKQKQVRGRVRCKKCLKDQLDRERKRAEAKQCSQLGL